MLLVIQVNRSERGVPQVARAARRARYEETLVYALDVPVVVGYGGGGRCGGRRGCRSVGVAVAGDIYVDEQELGKGKHMVQGVVAAATAHYFIYDRNHVMLAVNDIILQVVAVGPCRT